MIHTFRKNWLVIVIIALIYGTLFSYSVVHSEGIGKAKVEAQVLNVRSGPSTSNAVVGKLSYGNDVTVLKIVGEWAEIKAETKSFVHTGFLKIEKHNVLIMSSTANTLNVRDGASLSANVIGKLSKDEVISIVRVEGDWAVFLKDGKEHFASSFYLKEATENAVNNNSPGAAAIVQGKVIASSLNVRSEPSLQSSVIGSVKKDEIVSYQNHNELWAKTSISNGGVGYLSRQYIEDVAGDQQNSTESKEETFKSVAEIQTPLLNVRKGPSTQSAIIGSARQGEQYDVYEVLGDWANIQYNNAPAYVSKAYLMLTDNLLETEEKQVISKDNYKITATSLNIREEKSTSSRVIGKLPQNSIVEVHSVSDNWAEIVHLEKRAYISATYIKMNKTENNTSAVEIAEPFEVTASTLNVRKENSIGSSIVGKLNKGESVEVLGVIGDWAKVNYNKAIAYVASNYIKKTTDNTYTYQVTVDALNVRSKDSVTSPKVGQLSKLDTVTVVKEVNGWSEIKYKNGTAFVSSLYIEKRTDKNIAQTLKGKTVVLDAGHGGKDPGGVANSLEEKEVVFDVTNKLKRNLESAGAKVVLTRSSDVYLTLGARTRLSNNSNGDIFISIHGNISGVQSVNGIETFYYNNGNSTRRANSLSLASSIQRTLISKTGSKDRQVKTENFQVIAYNNLPSVLVEIGFLSNSEESAKLKSTSYREKIAEGLFLGVEEYFSN